MHTPVQAIPPLPTSTPDLEPQFTAAIKRAAAAKLFAYKINADAYEVPSATVPNQLHLVRRFGPGRYDWSCSGICGNHRLCQHRATAIWAAENGIRAARPRLCSNCHADRTAPGKRLCNPCAHVLARRVVAPELQAYEGAEKALRAVPVGTITRVGTSGPLDF